MRNTGRYSPTEDIFDLDNKINEVVILTLAFIVALKEEVGEEDYKKLAKIIIQEHLNQL